MAKKKLLRNGTTMTIAELEHALGFKWKKGLGAVRGADTPPPIARLQREVLQLCEEFAHMKDEDMKESHELEEALKVCFDNIGPTLWPSGQDRGAWLVDATTETSNGLYQDNLFFSDADDRETLWTRFQTYVTAKCVTCKRTRCADNTRRKKKKREYTETGPSDSNAPNDDINAIDAFTTAVDEQDEPQSRQRKITTEETVVSPQQNTVSPMRTRRGKAFGYGIAPSPETSLPSLDPVTPDEAFPSIEPRSASPLGPQTDVQQARPYSPYEKSPEVEPPRVATAAELAAGLEDILTHTTLLVEYSRSTESRISLKACYTNEELFDRIDKGMPYEIADAANVVGAAKVTVPGGEVVVLHPEYGTLEQRTLRVSEFRELLQQLFSLGVNAPIELGAVVEWDEDAWY